MSAGALHVISSGQADAAPLTFTAEQLVAVERREGDLLLDAGAGSGKTAVLVERFVRAVREDGLEVGRVLAITFTEKAATELRERIRERLRALGEDERARATEGAWISTIHGFCARVLRASALAAGIDPAFRVLDETEAGQLAELAFAGALEEVALQPQAVEVIAGYRVARLRWAIAAVHDELRSRGQWTPALPALAPVSPEAFEAARRALADARTAAAAELSRAPARGASVAVAYKRLEQCADVLAASDPWLGDIDAVRLRNGSASALSGTACDRYRDALEGFRTVCARREAMRAHAVLDGLLRGYSVRYAELKRERSALDFEDLELFTRELFTGRRELRRRYCERFGQIMVDELQDTNAVQLELIEAIAHENLFTVGDAFQSIYGFRHADVELFLERGERLSAAGAHLTLSANFRSTPELLDALNIAFAPVLGERFTPLRPGRAVAGDATGDEEAPPGGDAAPAGGGEAPAGGDAALPGGGEAPASGGAAPAGARDQAPPRADHAPPRADQAPSRTDHPPPPADQGPPVELIVVDKAADWGPSAGELSAAWRLAEARTLARRVRELVDDGAAPREIVLLARATTDLRAYERALEAQGVPTYVVGGRGYWSHPQVLDLVSYLRTLANPRDEEALYMVLASPLVAVSSAALVVLAAAAREARRDPWSTLREPEGLLDDLEHGERERLRQFERWFAAERERAARASIEELIERALELTGYDLAMLAMPGGERRLANVRKLMRLAREHESRYGPNLRGFLDLVAGLASGRLSEARESEAPVEGEALDAVRLMTIHRAKGLEFEIVCVADLGRTPRGKGTDILRLDRDGRLGLKVARAGRGRLLPALDYDLVGIAREEAEDREEHRLYYVAMTRARERLIVSGALACAPWPERRRGSPPLAWIAPAFVPDIAARVDAEELAGAIERREGPWRARVAYAIVRPGEEEAAEGTERDGDVPDRPCSPPAEPRPAAPAPAALPACAAEPRVGGSRVGGASISSLSYSSLGEYARCGYRFYLERVLGLPAVARGTGGPGGSVATGPTGAPRPLATRGHVASAPPVLSPAERGVLIHALLEGLDFRRGRAPTQRDAERAAARSGLQVELSQLEEAVAMVSRLLDTELARRLAAAGEVRREEPFAFLLGGPVASGEASLDGAASGDGAPGAAPPAGAPPAGAPYGVVVSGYLDVLAREGPRTLVVDYKSDRLDGGDPAVVVASEYAVQRLIYVLAALKSGAQEVEVVHVFLEDPGRPVSASYSRAQLEALERELAALAGGVLRREFAITEMPHRVVCHGCPAEGGLCSWPLELTRRERVDTLF